MFFVAVPPWKQARPSYRCGSCRSCPTSEAKSRLSTCTCARARRESLTRSACKRLSATIEAAFPGLKALPASVRARNNQLVVLARSIAWGTSVIALFIGALGIANTMAMSVFERTKEIGVLRSLGWRRSRVMKLILIEAAILGLVGGCIGVLGGWLTLRILAGLPFTASFVTSSIPPLICGEALGISVVVGLLAGFLPAQRGARLSPRGGLAI